MTLAYSPLRYPGGKQVLARVLSHLISINGNEGGTYVEPYAGGAGAALTLLFGEHVHRILINDADPCVHAFWMSVLNDTERFAKLIRTTPLTMEEWERQRDIYRKPARYSDLRIGFATFFLNRCNRSGIIVNGGPIGGRKQEGRWKLDARFNREELENRIHRIALYKDRISVSCLDAVKFLDKRVAHLGARAKAFVYLEPPYFTKARDLYLNYYEPGDHAALATFLRKAKFSWVLSYDNVPQITKLYSGLRQVRFGLDYHARQRRRGREVMILKQGLAFPSTWKTRIPKAFITAAGTIGTTSN